MANDNIILNITARASNLKATLQGVTNTVKKSTNGYAGWYKAMRETNKSMQSLNKDANRTGQSLNGMGKAVGRLNMLFGMGQSMAYANALAKMVQSAFDMIETQNLFAVSMGKSTAEAEKFAEALQKAYGFDLTNIQSSMGTFALLGRSMGFTTKNAQIMSENTTKLAYDLASLMNVPVLQAMQDLRSGLVGQSETMYKYGVDVTEASLKQEALRQGIEKSVRNMSQGEKMALRYAVMLRQTGLAQGDFARTINTPANQLKVLGERFITLGRSIGTIFVPAISATLPYLNALVLALTMLADEIARFFGYVATTPKDLSKIGNNFTGIEDGADDASSAVKKLKQNMNSLGMDELNTINKDSKAGAGGAGANGGMSFDLKGYDNMMGKINDTTKALAEKMLPALKAILLTAGAIKLAFLSWNIAKFIGSLGGASRLMGDIVGFLAMVKEFGLAKTLAGLLPAGFLATLATASGIFATVGGSVLYLKGMFDLLTEKTPSVKSLAEALGGIGLVAGGVLLVFGGLPALITACVMALVTLGIQIYKNWEDLKWFAGYLGQELGKKMAEIWTKIKDKTVEIFTDMSKKISQIWDDIKKWISDKITDIKDFCLETVPTITQNILKFFADLPYNIGYAIGFVIGTLATWVVNCVNWATENIPTIIDSVVKFFKYLPQNIYDVIIFLKDKIVLWATNAVQWFGQEVPKILTSVGNFFGGLGSSIYKKIVAVKDTIVTWTGDMISWFSQNVPKIINSITDWFSKLPNSMVNIGKNMIYGLWNGILSVGNWLRTKVMEYLGMLGEVVKEMFNGVGEGVKASYAPIPKYASGGFPDMGSMFIANEAGAELVGNIGGKTAVVNNDQIVESVAQGVARAVASVMGNGQQQANIVVQLDGEVIYKNQQKISNGRGYDFGMGVFAR